VNESEHAAPVINLSPKCERQTNKQDIQAATGKDDNLEVLFASGLLNLMQVLCVTQSQFPRTYSVAVGHHFARPGNQFFFSGWIHFAGFGRPTV
jgi:hypothetical protein